MQPGELSDEDLMAQLQAGNPSALRGLMERFRSPLYGYLYRMLSSSEDAEDLFQEVFLRVLRHADRFQVGRPFRPWLYAIATNLEASVLFLVELISIRSTFDDSRLEFHQQSRKRLSRLW